MMASSPFLVLVLGVLLSLLLIARESHSQRQAAGCNADDECGVNSTCSTFQLCSCNTSFFSISGSNDDCWPLSEPHPRCARLDSDCVYCGMNFEGPCRRCVEFIYSTNDSCAEQCPDDVGIVEFNVIQGTTIPSRTCIVEEVRSRFPQWALIVIIVVGVIVLLTLSIVGFVLVACCLQRSSRGEFDVRGSSKLEGMSDSQQGTLRTRRSNSFSFSKSIDEADASLVTKNPHVYKEDDDDEDEIDGDDETIFKGKLMKLRKKSEIFLRMLNEMRRRLRELPPDSPVAEQYNNVIRDVTRLLYMLNKKPSKVKMPVDGVQLMRWSENILKRYLASQEGEESLGPGRVPSFIEGGSRDSMVFMEKLAYLRDNAQVFLRMLNEMRRRLKELRPDTPTAQNYRAISKDVTRLIELLNKRPSTVQMPADGLELVKKSEQLLERYLQSQGVSQETEKLGEYGLQDVETEF